MGKKVNYTAEMVDTMLEVYGNAENDAERKSAVETLASMLGRSVPSVRTKLSQLKVYIKPDNGKTGEKSDTVSKADLVLTIEDLLGLHPGEGKSLKFATKVVLEAIVEALNPLQEAAEADSADAAREAAES